MNLVSFRYFLAAARELNFTKAAKSLYITQQSLSEHIRRLEDEYHVKLFERTPVLRLTNAGVLLMRYATEALDLDNQISNVMSDVAAEKRGSVSIGMRAFYGCILLPEIIPAANQANPGIQFHVTLGRSQDLANLLLVGQLDLAILIRPYATNSNFINVPIFTDKYCLVVPENLLESYFGVTGKELDQGKTLDYSGLDRVPFILYKSGTTRACTEQFLISNDCRHPNILMETANTEVQLILCSSGCGVTVTYERLCAYYEKTRQGGYRLFSVPLHDLVANDTVVSYYSGRKFSSAARSLLEIIQERASRI